MALVMVLSLSVSGTLAYLTWNANAAPNRVTVAQDVGVQIVESTSWGAGDKDAGGTTTDKKFHDATDDSGSQNQADLGDGNKSAQLSATRVDGSATSPGAMRMSLTPEAELLDEDGTTVLGNAFLEENWSAPTQVNSKWVMSNNLFKVILADDWQTYYLYVDGAFVYKTIVNKDDVTKTLVTGVEWTGSAKDRLNYGAIKLNVIADAIDQTETSLALWGLQKDDSGNITQKS